jgi:hypothetical protein
METKYICTNPTLLKVLTKDMMSPTSPVPLKWELGEWHKVKNFNANPNVDCGFPRLYATEIEGLPYTFRVEEGHRVFEVRAGGENVNINPCKRGWSVMMPVREVFKDELIALALAKEPELGYKLSKCIFPVNPRELPVISLTDRHIELLRLWSAAESAARSAAESAARSAAESAARSAAEYAAEYAAWDAAEYAVWSAARDAAESAARSAAVDAVWSAARDAAESAARDAARDAAESAARSAAVDAVWSAARAYTLSLFPNIITTLKLPDATLKAIDAIAELWESGVVPLYYNQKWHLHTGADSHVIWAGAL